MPGKLQPLVSNQAIVRADGTPTEYFIRWAQQRQIDISDGISAADAQELIDEALADYVQKTRHINSGTGLAGGGDLSADRTLRLQDTMVIAGTYGDATHVAQITVDAQGRLTDVDTVPISGGGGGGSPASHYLLQPSWYPTTQGNAVWTNPFILDPGQTVLGLACTFYQTATVNWQMGLYNDAGTAPGNLLAATVAQTAIVNGTVYKLPLVSAYTNSGSDPIRLWSAVTWASVSLIVGAGSSAPFAYQSGGGGTLPGTFSSSGTGYGSNAPIVCPYVA